MPEDILTVPARIQSQRTYLATGNEYISFPDINPKDGGISSLTVLHYGAAGLLEFCGSANNPLVRPYIKTDDKPVHFLMTWSYQRHWLPVFSAKSASLVIEGKIFAPPSHRGAVYLLRVKNISNNALTVEAGFAVESAGVNRRIFQTKKLSEPLHAAFDRWTKSFVLEIGSSIPLAALAFGLDTDVPWWLRDYSCRADAARIINMQAGESIVVPLYIGVNLEGSGASTTVVDLRRWGWEKLQKQTENWLEEHSVSLTHFNSQANRNLFFNYFFALGRAIDTDGWVPVTSRSPKYYVSAAFWGRDTLLWSFPGLVITDHQTARDVLLAVYNRHLQRAGEHAHYISGVLLYPGFELDQLAAYVLALKLYLETTGDRTVLDEKSVKSAMVVITEKILTCYDEEIGLCKTFLDPSDDPVQYPYLIYDNALTQRALTFLAWLAGKGWPLPGEPALLAAQIRNAVYRHGVVKGPIGPMFAWAVDGYGAFQLYDNPPGSLQLLPYYGFCRRDEPVWENTVQWIHSTHNPFWRQGNRICGAASRHAHDPWPLAAANDLLGLNVEGGRFFTLASMDSGFCCETVDPDNGRVATGQAFASAAGFIGYALYRVFASNTSCINTAIRQSADKIPGKKKKTGGKNRGK